jgi:rod shape-determining protein MreC
MLRVIGPFSRNKANWYLLISWALAIALLSLPKPYKGTLSQLIWQVFYAPFYQAGETVRNLHQVQQENLRLKRELAALEIEKNILEEERLENRRLRQLLDLRTDLDFEVIPAEVRARDPSFKTATIQINSGSQTGVERNLPVIDGRGLVGKVIEAFPKYSVVQMLYDPGFKVSALVQRSRVTGLLVWRGGRFLELEYVPIDADVTVGDEVVTSGLGTIYPSGLKIGKVSRVSQEPNSLFKTVEVSAYAELDQVEELFVIKAYTQ